MKIIVLGSGTSTGVPEIGCKCEVCTSTDPKDKRLRTSLLIHAEGRNILLDCGPDFRAQILPQPFERLHAVLISHEHYDHVGGLDDLRPFCRFGEIPIYADAYTVTQVKKRIPYCFSEQLYPGVPALSLCPVIPTESFHVAGVKVTPIQVFHGKLPILGYRIGNMAYITDMLTLPEEEYEKLSGLDCLFMNALRINPHATHQTLEQALENTKRIGAKETYFIHMSHHMGLHRKIEDLLPTGVHLSYDGLEITL